MHVQFSPLLTVNSCKFLLAVKKSCLKWCVCSLCSAVDSIPGKTEAINTGTKQLKIFCVCWKICPMLKEVSEAAWCYLANIYTVCLVFGPDASTGSEASTGTVAIVF